MGKGDKRTKKGKIKAASHGICRPSKVKVKPRREKVKLVFAKEDAPVTTVKATKIKATDDVAAEESVA